ncbi:MAG: dTMP kinase [Nanoarchaeota archaeon]
MESGKFIVLEGIDGAGTTTHSGLLVQYLFEKDKKNAVLLTREPTKLSPYGLELRRRLTGNLLPGETVINDPAYWADLFVSDRRWHMNKVVTPSLQLGLQVISDRYDISTIAYQSAQGKEMDELIKKHEGLPVPDLTLLLDLPVETAMHRVGKD